MQVRVKGTGHSEPGIVQNKGDGKVVIISMANYWPTPDWNGTLSTGSSPTVRIGTGRTYMDVMSIIRPAGYRLKSTTAGFFFSVGGVVANPSVHGSAFASDRMSSHMSACKVMLANGTILHITDASEIVNWRGSMGYLGVILAAQLDIASDTGVAMRYFNVHFCGPTSNSCVNSWNGGFENLFWFG
jgi:FAD/FMN-containing dehydrogenase